MIDFVATYMPAYAELTRDEVLDARERIEGYMKVGFPDIETSPSSVTGDLLVTPQAYTLAALEMGMDRFMSDLDLGNVAAGVIFNCDFVERYLGNFSVYPSAGLRASGVARLVFNTNRDYELDRGMRFSFGQAVFSIHLPFHGPFVIHRVGGSVQPDENGTVLHDAGDGLFFADVPVVGNSGAASVAAGTSGLINRTDIPELGAVTALSQFDPGEETYTLPQLAERARDTVYAASLNTRMGAIQYVKAACPFVESVHAVRNGDHEMTRTFDAATGTVAGCLDLYVRSKSYSFTEEQRLKLYYDEEHDDFRGEFPYTGQIYHFESITEGNLPDVEDLPHTITSYNDAHAGLGPLAAYTVHEKLRIAVDKAVDSNGNILYTQYTDEDGRVYAVFTVRYQTDPMFRAINNAVSNSDYAPVNTSILVRGFIPVVISRFEVVYVKQRGVVPLLDEARDRIKAYMAALGSGDAYSDAEVARIMGEAGVKYVKTVNVVAKVQWSVADRILGTDDTTEEAVPAMPVVMSSSGLRVTYPARGASRTGRYACTPRNIRYYFLEGALSFKEVRED